MLFRSPAGARETEVQNPFSLRAALAFGGIYAGAVLVVRAAGAWLGASGTLLAAGISGLVDVDAVALALARGADRVGVDQAAVGIVIACSSNNLFKAGIGVGRGGGRFRRDFAWALAFMTAAGAAAAALTLHFF